MINLYLLEGLSYTGAEAFVLESGYISEGEIRMASDECDVKIIHCYVLYENKEKIIDQIGYVEYCNVDSSGEIDDFKWEWTRMGI